MSCYPHALRSHRQVMTATCYHLKRRRFSEEIKLELPVNIRPSHHLLFTLFNVSCKDKVSRISDINRPEKVLGYAVLPLLHNGRIADTFHHLPVFPTLKAHYLLFLNDEWDKCNPKAVFQVRCRLESSLYTQCPFLHTFLGRAAAAVYGASVTDLSDEEQVGRPPTPFPCVGGALSGILGVCGDI